MSVVTLKGTRERLKYLNSKLISEAFEALHWNLERVNVCAGEEEARHLFA